MNCSKISYSVGFISDPNCGTILTIIDIRISSYPSAVTTPTIVVHFTVAQLVTILHILTSTDDVHATDLHSTAPPCIGLEIDRFTD
jgi:hypothetical protein